MEHLGSCLGYFSEVCHGDVLFSQSQKVGATAHRSGDKALLLRVCILALYLINNGHNKWSLL